MRGLPATSARGGDRRPADAPPLRRTGMPASSRASSPRSSLVRPRSAAASVQSSPVAVSSSRSRRRATVVGAFARAGTRPLSAASAARTSPPPLLRRSRVLRERRVSCGCAAPRSLAWSIGIASDRFAGGLGRRPRFVGAPTRTLMPSLMTRARFRARGRVSASCGSNRVPSRSIHWCVRSALASTSTPGEAGVSFDRREDVSRLRAPWLRGQFHDNFRTAVVRSDLDATDDRTDVLGEGASLALPFGRELRCRERAVHRRVTASAGVTGAPSPLTTLDVPLHRGDGFLQRRRPIHERCRPR